MMWDDNGTWNTGDWVAMSLMMVIFWGLLVVAVVAFVRWSRRDAATSRTASPPETAEQLLANRFARGDLDEEDYRRRLSVLVSAREQRV